MRITWKTLTKDVWTSRGLCSGAYREWSQFDTPKQAFERCTNNHNLTWGIGAVIPKHEAADIFWSIELPIITPYLAEACMEPEVQLAYELVSQWMETKMYTPAMHESRTVIDGIQNRSISGRTEEAQEIIYLLLDWLIVANPNSTDHARSIACSTTHIRKILQSAGGDSDDPYEKWGVILCDTIRSKVPWKRMQKELFTLIAGD